jgi:hypothetical protein
MRIEIHGVVVRVFAQDGSNFQEVMPGGFHIAPVQANAVIFATDFAQQGGWVETWAFAVTLKDDHTLIAEYSRIVNNVGVPADQPESKFAARGTGEFKRAAP